MDSNDLRAADPGAIRAACARVIASQPFRTSPRMIRFLEFVVEKTLAGDADQLKEYLLGVEVFERPESFDPKTDTIVRVEARRLRRKLAEYYESEGANDPTRIDVPSPGYVPEFTRTRSTSEQITPEVGDTPVNGTTVARLDAPGEVRPPRRRTFLLITATVVAALAIAAGLWGVFRSSPRIDSIAVLPFNDMSPARDQEYFCDGFSEELISTLAETKNLRVVARTSSFAFKGKSVDIRDIGHQLNADAIVEGSVRRAGGNLRITAQLIRVRDGYHLWAKSYDRKAEDVLAVEQELASTVASTLQKQFGKSPSDSVRVPNLQARDLYLLGRYHWNRFEPDDLDKAVDYFQQSIALEPDSAQAYAGLADAYSYMIDLDIKPAAEILPKARAAADRALALNPNSADAHTARGLVAHELEWDQPRARAEFRRAIELNPNYAYGVHWWAHYLEASDRLEDARAEMGKALLLDPLSRMITFDVAMLDYKLHRYDAALKGLARVQELDPDFIALDVTRGMVYQEQHDWPRALAAYRKARERMQGSAMPLAMLAQASALSGDRTSATQYMKELKRTQATSFVPEYLLAMGEYAVGDHDAAIQSLEKALAARGGFLVWFKSTPAFAQLNADPRGKAILDQVGGKFPD